MRTSEEINELAAALSKAQGEIKNIEKTKVHPHLKSRYADIADGLDVIRPVLSKFNLSLAQATTVNYETGAFFLVTRLMHSSGQWIESVYPLQTGKPMEQGSALTYARRYSAFALIGVAGTTEDDDGNAANGSVAHSASVIKKNETAAKKEELLTKANAIAAEGTEALRKWWPTLPQTERALLNATEINELKDKAAQIDTLKGEEE